MSETEKKISELVVTKGGVPFEDQTEGLRQFKEACLRAAHNPKPDPTDGVWTSFEALQTIYEKGRESARDDVAKLEAQVAELEKRNGELVEGLRETLGDLCSQLEWETGLIDDEINTRPTVAKARVLLDGDSK